MIEAISHVLSDQGIGRGLHLRSDGTGLDSAHLGVQCYRDDTVDNVISGSLGKGELTVRASGVLGGERDRIVEDIVSELGSAGTCLSAITRVVHSDHKKGLSTNSLKVTASFIALAALGLLLGTV